jgi:hypothetical protein
MSASLPVDHVIILVPDLDAAGTAFEAAGFHVTPRTEHSAAMGTANRCVMLTGSYIELLGIVAGTPANTTWRALLAAGPGLRGVALRSVDIDASVEELAAQEIAVEAVRHFSRATDEGELRFSIVRIDPAATPGLQCLVCQHHTASLLWRAETMQHANGAAAMQAVVLPQAEALQHLSLNKTSTGIELIKGPGRLVLSGDRAHYADLRDVCGVEIEMIAQ